MRKYTPIIFFCFLMSLSLTAQCFSRRMAVAPAPSPSPRLIAGTITHVVASPTPVSSAVPWPFPSASPTPPVAGIKFLPTDGYATASEAAKIRAASNVAYSVIHSQCFRAFMTGRKLIQTDGRTPKQVVDHLQALSGSSFVTMYYRRMGGLFGTSAVAYREPPSRDVNLNRAWFTTDMPDCEWAATLAHEGYGHAWGEYDHDVNWSASRSFSVPYSMGGADESQGGDAFNQCCRN